jgi:hypothetical protein
LVQSAGLSASHEPVEVLEAHIPSSFSDTCKRDDSHEVMTFALVSLACEPGRPVDTVQYSWFHDAEAMREKFGADLAQAGFPGAGGALDPYLSDTSDDFVRLCSSSGRALASFWMAKTTREDGRGTHNLGSDRPESATRGRVLCLAPPRKTRLLEWYDGDTHIFAWATSTHSVSDLFGWWQAEGGPWHPPMDVSAMH